MLFIKKAIFLEKKIKQIAPNRYIPLTIFKIHQYQLLSACSIKKTIISIFFLTKEKE